jgi:hypothetical protein
MDGMKGASKRNVSPVVVGAMAAALLQACSSKAQDAEDQYNIVSNSGSLGEQCAKAREVRDAYLAQHDEDDYSRWKLHSDIVCLQADQEGAEMPANDKERAAVENQAASDALNASVIGTSHNDVDFPDANEVANNSGE